MVHCNQVHKAVMRFVCDLFLLGLAHQGPSGQYRGALCHSQGVLQGRQVTVVHRLHTGGSVQLMLMHRIDWLHAAGLVRECGLTV